MQLPLDKNNLTKQRQKFTNDASDIDSTTTSVHSEDRPAPNEIKDNDLCYIEHVVFSCYEIKCWYPSPYLLDGLVTDNNNSQTSKTSAFSSNNVSNGSVQVAAAQPRGPRGRFQSQKSVYCDPSSPNFSPVRLYVCDGCFKYCLSPTFYSKHKKLCTYKKPPGKKVYQRGSISIFEVDGSDYKLYCQNLALFGKLFLDHKFVFYDLDGFKLYVLTEAKPSFDHVLGFFSKEKISYEDYNLACIVTFPPYQRMGYGTLMIEFSYELSKREFTNGKAGSPERPLSDLGLRSYLVYWTSVLIRYFRSLFDDESQITANSSFIDQLQPENLQQQQQQQQQQTQQTQQDRPKRYKGWEGELPPSKRRTSKRLRADSSTNTTSSSSSSAETSNPQSPQVNNNAKASSKRLHTTVEEIAIATYLRPDDVSHALMESGLAKRRKPATTTSTSVNHGSIEPIGVTSETTNADKNNATGEIVITPDIVEQVATRIKLKPTLLDPSYCLF